MAQFKHFTVKEFFPHCTKDEIVYVLGQSIFKYIIQLDTFLEGFREYVRQPIVITSGYRSKEHNEQVGGSPTSQHLSCCAVDFYCPLYDTLSLMKDLDRYIGEKGLGFELGQVIYYPSKNIIHLALPSLTYNHYRPFFKTSTGIHIYKPS